MIVASGVQSGDFHVPVGLRSVLVIQLQRVDVGKPGQVDRRAGDAGGGELQGRETVRDDAHRDVVQKEVPLAVGHVTEGDAGGVGGSLAAEIHDILVIVVVGEEGRIDLIDAHERAAVSRVGDVTHMQHAGGGIFGTRVEGDSQTLQVFGEMGHDGGGRVRRVGAEDYAGRQGVRIMEGVGVHEGHREGVGGLRGAVESQPAVGEHVGTVTVEVLVVRENGVGAAFGHEGVDHTRCLGAVRTDGGHVPVVVGGGLQSGKGEGAAVKDGRHGAEVHLVGLAVVHHVFRGCAAPAEVGGRLGHVGHVQRGRLRTAGDDGDGDVVHEDAARLVARPVADVAERDVVVAARVAGLVEIDRVERVARARHGDGGHRHEGGNVHRIGHQTHLQRAQHVGAEQVLRLAGVELDAQIFDVLGDFRGHEDGGGAVLGADLQIAGAGIGVGGGSLQSREVHVPVEGVFDDALLRYGPAVHHAFGLEVDEVGGAGGRAAGYDGDLAVHVVRHLLAVRRDFDEVGGVRLQTADVNRVRRGGLVVPDSVALHLIAGEVAVVHAVPRESHAAFADGGDGQMLHFRAFGDLLQKDVVHTEVHQ